MTELLLALALGASALSNFPRDAGGRISQHAIGVSIGGAPAVVVAAGDRVLAFRGDGSHVPGFPFSLGAGEAAAGAPAVADVNGDGRPEIAVVTTSGRLFLWSGGIVPGFPIDLGAHARAGASFADVDGDGKPELLVGDENGRVHAFRRTGRELPGWPAAVGSAVTSTVSSSRFAGGRSFAFGCEDGKVHVLDAAGKERAGFPLTTKFTVTGAPAFADLDDDGEMDLIASSQDFGVYAVNGKGKALPGFPVRAGYRIYEGAAVADVEGDRHLDVVFASADGVVHAVNARGEPLKGFPVKIGNRLFTGPAVGDIDRDGAQEIVAVTSDGSVVAISSGGKILPGFPHVLQATDVGASPLLYEANGDGTPTIFVGLPDGALHALRATKSGSAHAAIAWAGPGRDPGHGGRYGPNPPGYKDLAVEPAAPRALDVVRARYRTVWLDAGADEAIPAPRIEWLRNGEPIAGLEGKKELPARTMKRGEKWRFALSSAGSSSRWESPEVRVLDTPPGAPTIAFDPPMPSRASDIRAVLKADASDPDGDPLTYETTWFLDGVDTGRRGERFPSNQLRRGAVLTARVVASDGELKGPAATAQVRVGNTPPGPTAASLEPASPGRADTIRARIDTPAVDPDGDKVTYHYRWTVDGELRNLPLSTASLSGVHFRKHQKVEVDVRAFDGLAEGPPAKASVTIRNTPPGPLRVEIRPAHPRRGDTLRASVVTPSADVDGDLVAYRVEWKKNGAPLKKAQEDGREVPGDEVAKGDVFEVTVTPHDGEEPGPAATARVTVGNTPPTPPRIALDPARPKGGDTLKLLMPEPARDVDGEKVGLHIVWTREGKPTGLANDTLPSNQFKKHERVRVLVTPYDSEGAGASAALEVTVANAPPTAPVVAFASERPTVTSPLKAILKARATDPDGDELRYEYRWIVDGTAIPVPDGGEHSRAAPFWTSVSEIPQKALKKGQRWTVEVRAHDGEQPGPVASASTTIANTPPPAPKVSFAPERPRRVDGISLRIEQEPDADGDLVTYRYAWTRDGKPVEGPPDQAQIPRGLARKGERWAVEVIASDGEADSPAVRREVVIADTAPGPIAVALCDGPVPTGTIPEARITAPAIDADGDTVTYRHEWTVNGRPVPTAAGQTRLASPALQKHDLVRVTVTPFDGELAGPPAYGECQVVNTPPTVPAIAVEPAEPSAPRGASVVIKKPSTDRDGDAVSYRFAWFRDGIKTSHDRAIMPAGVMRHGEVWRVEVTPFDGEEPGETVTASMVVKNTPPDPPAVSLVPPDPAAGEPVHCEAYGPDVDPDQEPVTWRYRWYRNGLPVQVADGSPELPAKLLRRGDKWRCEAAGFDGTAEGKPGFAEATVKNSPPTAPKISIEPELPRRDDDLFCRIESPSVDPDDDPVTYTYAWVRNDKPIEAASDARGLSRIDGARVRKGDRFRCTATPSDGTIPGPSGVAEKVIANTPPGPAIARIEPASPREGEPIRCEVVSKSEDPDGDAVRYRFAWQRNGSAQAFAESSQEIPPRLIRVGDRWRCSATPTDGTDDGPTSTTEETIVVPGAVAQGSDGPVGPPTEVPSSVPSAKRKAR